MASEIPEKIFSTRHECPICTSGKFSELYRLPYLSSEIKSYLSDFYFSHAVAEFEYLENADYILCECANCEAIFQKEIPGDALMLRLYEKWIHPVNVAENRRSLSYSHFKNYADEVARIASLFKAPPASLRFCDFGLGWGDWALMAKAHGISSYGTELSNERIEHSRANGIKVISWDEIPGKDFDFINTEQVFEHLDKPLETLRHLKSGLKKGGIIKISVPYAHDIKRRLQSIDWKDKQGIAATLSPVAPLEHINYFRRKSIVKMGHIVGMQEHRFPISNQYSNSRIFGEGLKDTIKNLARPIYRSTIDNYILLQY